MKEYKLLDVIIIGTNYDKVHRGVNKFPDNFKYSQYVNDILIPKIRKDQTLCASRVCIDDNIEKCLVIVCSDIATYSDEYNDAIEYTRKVWKKYNYDIVDGVKISSWFGYGLGYRCATDVDELLIK